MYERELTLDELLNEPIIREVMIADGYNAEDIRLLMRQATARSNEEGYHQRSSQGAQTARLGRARRSQMMASRYQPSA
jgi:hypothetical protein